MFGALILEDDLTPARMSRATWFPFPVPRGERQPHGADAQSRRRRPVQLPGSRRRVPRGRLQPRHPGPEVFLTAEQPADFHSIGPDGDRGLGYRPSAAVYDPRTGEVLVGMYSLAGDLERGVAANIDPNQPGAEFWTNGFVWSAITGERLLRQRQRARGPAAQLPARTGTATCSASSSTATPSRRRTPTTRRCRRVVGDTNLLVAAGASGTNDGGRNSPIVSADLFGDGARRSLGRRRFTHRPRGTSARLSTAA